MKSHKNIVHLILVLAMLFSLLVGCGMKNENIPESSAPDSSASSSAIEQPADNTAFSYSEGIDENGFWQDIKALDYVENLNYKALPIPSEVHQISEDHLQTEITKMLKYYATSEQITNRDIVNGDTVNIDYVGSVDGVEFEGGSTMGAGTEVTIGVTSYIDDFLEQLIGHKPGETINVQVTFPDVYQQESLQGKDAVFVTTINHIVDLKQPELTDDFIKTNFFASSGWQTVADMKEEVSSNLQKDALYQYINNYLKNDITLSSIPDNLIAYQENAMMQYYMEGAEYYGMAFDEFLSTYVGVASVDELMAQSRTSNTQQAAYTLAIQAVAEDAKISVSQEDMATYLPDYEQYEEQYGLPYLKQAALSQKVTDYIIDHSVLQ